MTQLFTGKICNETKKIIDIIFKDCSQRDLEKLHLTSYRLVSDCEAFKFWDYWEVSKPTIGCCELRFIVEDRTDYEIIVIGTQCENGKAYISYKEY